jgi:hypothetical protein
MNPLIGTLMLFSGILILFFGVPISGLFLMSMLGPASTVSISKPMPITPMASPMPDFIGDPITIQKVYHKGNFVWVDASPVTVAV